MSNVTELDLREQITRIDRAIAETRKFQEESDRFAAETRRISRETQWCPWIQLAGSGAIAALIAAIVAHWR